MQNRDKERLSKLGNLLFFPPTFCSFSFFLLLFLKFSRISWQGRFLEVNAFNSYLSEKSFFQIWLIKRLFGNFIHSAFLCLMEKPDKGLMACVFLAAFKNLLGCVWRGCLRRICRMLGWLNAKQIKCPTCCATVLAPNISNFS